MKKITLLFLLISFTGFSQILEPVKWETSVEKISDYEYNLIFTATIDDSWHLYSQKIPENGPLPTQFKLNPNSNYKPSGEPSEEKGLIVFEEVFDMKIKYFEKKAVFIQNIKVISKNDFKINGTIEFMSCNSEKCIPGYEDFEFEIK